MNKTYADLNSAITERKSVRKYDLSKQIDFLEDGTNLMEKFKLIPLYKDHECKIVVLDSNQIKNTKSKYTIAFYADDSKEGAINVGYLGEQLSLHLHKLGIGTCWQGITKPTSDAREIDGLKFIISFWVGYPAESLKRELEAFIRTDIEKLCIGGKNSFIEAVRLAPSAVNNQPYCIVANENQYDFYLTHGKNPIIGMLITKLSYIDIGIAISHFVVAAYAEDKKIDFFSSTEKKIQNSSIPQKAEYIISLQIN